MSFNKIIKELELENAFTAPPKKQKSFNHVKNGIPLIRGLNFEADLLHLPTSETGNKYLLVIIDLADNSFDIEELENRDAKSVLDGLKSILKRNYIKSPEVSIRTDAGSEFQKEFDKYLKQEKIIHSVTLPNRHKQNANVESLNRQLGKVFNAYMNKKELDEGEEYTNWDDITSTVRKKGNEIKKVKLPKYAEWSIKIFDQVKAGEPKYKIGDFVYRALDAPKSALNKNQPTKRFREGDFRWDIVARKIEKVIYMPDYPYYRYMIHGIKQASFSENELMPSTEKNQKYEIQKFVGFRTKNKVKQVNIKWKGLPVSQNSWEDIDNVIEDIGKKSFDDYTKVYNEDYKKLDAKFIKLNEQQTVKEIEQEFEQLNKKQDAKQEDTTGLRRSERIRNQKK